MVQCVELVSSSELRSHSSTALQRLALSAITVISVSSRSQVFHASRHLRRLERQCMGDGRGYAPGSVQLFELLSQFYRRDFSPYTAEHWPRIDFLHFLYTNHDNCVFFQVFRFPKNSSTIDLMLGQRFQPGSEDNCFCKPADVTVTSSGEVFVADG